MYLTKAENSYLKKIYAQTKALHDDYNELLLLELEGKRQSSEYVEKMKNLYQKTMQERELYLNLSNIWNFDFCKYLESTCGEILDSSEAIYSCSVEHTIIKRIYFQLQFFQIVCEVDLQEGEDDEVLSFLDDSPQQVIQDVLTSDCFFQQRQIDYTKVLASILESEMTLSVQELDISKILKVFYYFCFSHPVLEPTLFSNYFSFPFPSLVIDEEEREERSSFFFSEAMESLENVFRYDDSSLGDVDFIFVLCSFLALFYFLEGEEKEVVQNALRAMEYDIGVHQEKLFDYVTIRLNHVELDKELMIKNKFKLKTFRE